MGRTSATSRSFAAELDYTTERILTMLVRHERTLSTGTMARALRLTPTTVTRHCRILRQRNLVEVARKHGNELVFKATPDGRALVQLLDETESHLNGDTPVPVEAEVLATPRGQSADRSAMEAAIWAWANKITPQQLAATPRGQITALWEATR
jgi:DNA-binding MarR family transcriptional regulator